MQLNFTRLYTEYSENSTLVNSVNISVSVVILIIISTYWYTQINWYKRYNHYRGISVDEFYAYRQLYNNHLYHRL
jgi:hypothetical protein